MPDVQPTIDLSLGPKRTGRTPRSKSWVFTINNPVDQPTLSSFDGLRYGVYQLESGEMGTPHLQGYLYFNNNVSRKRVSTLLGGGAYIEVARGTPEQCRDYCTKLSGRISDPVVYGELPVRGKRNDLFKLRDAVLSGRTDEELLRDENIGDTFMRYVDLPGRIRMLITKPRYLSDPPSVTLCIGGPGTGKSHWIRELYPTAYHKPNNQWWPNYQFEDTVVFDDFNGSHCSFTDLKLILDKGPYIASIKNGHTQLIASSFIIGSNFHPKDWYSSSVYGDHGYKAIARRITRVLHFTALGVYTEHQDPAKWLETYYDTCF